jgi:hypothetical protein
MPDGLTTWYISHPTSYAWILAFLFKNDRVLIESSMKTWLSIPHPVREAVCSSLLSVVE